MPDLHTASLAYREKFNDAPTTIGLPVGKREKAAELLTKAVEDDEPFGSDAAWYKALDLEPPPDDALI